MVDFRILKKDMSVQGISLINVINLNELELEKIRKWRNHSEIRKWMYTNHLISKNEHLKYIDSLKKSKNRFSWLLKKEEKYLGVLNFNNVDYKNKHLYFGQYSNPNSKIPGMGWITDKIVMEMTFEILNFKTIKLEALIENPIIKIHKKVGFEKEGILKDYVYKNGIWKNVMIMGITSKHKEELK